MRPLLGPLITPETVVFHPTKELNVLCRQEHFNMEKPIKSTNKGGTSITIKVEADGILFEHTTVANKRIAKNVACKAVLDSLKKHVAMTRAPEVGKR